MEITCKMKYVLFQSITWLLRKTIIWLAALSVESFMYNDCPAGAPIQKTIKIPGAWAKPYGTTTKSRAVSVMSLWAVEEMPAGSTSMRATLAMPEGKMPNKAQREQQPRKDEKLGLGGIGS